MTRSWIAPAAGMALAVGAAFSGQAKTLVYCSEASPEGFTPAFSSSNVTFDASSRQIFDRLLEFERGTTKLIPGLAESWEISPDGLTVTLHLRKGVKFQNTAGSTPSRDFNADDVLFSFNRQWKEDHPYHKVSGGSFEYFDSMDFPKLLKSIDKIDDNTIRFVLNAPEAPFLADLAMDFASIHSAEYADKLMKAGTPEKFDQEPVGTGPFLLVNYQKDTTIRYKAHPAYWRGKAPIDDLVFAITTDASVRYSKLRANECQVMALPNPADLDSIKKDPSLKLDTQPGLNIGFWAFNTEKKPFDDKRVRQALSMAVDKRRILEAVYIGTGANAVNPIPPTIWSWNDTVKDFPYDPDKAKQLLAAAGVPAGFEMEVWAMPVARAYNPNARRMAELIQADLDKIGVKAKIVSYEWGEFLKRTKAGEHQTTLMGWTGDNGDPDNFFYPLLGCAAAKDGTNRARWCNQKFGEMITQAKRISDQEKRAELYKQAQVIFKDESPWLTIAHSITNQPMRKEVVGYKINPLGDHDFYGVDLQPWRASSRL
jgi:dipeptide transport system substrate-binding protein